MKLYAIIAWIALAVAFAFTALFYALVALGGNGMDIAYFGLLWLGLLLVSFAPTWVAYPVAVLIGVLFSIPASLWYAELPIGVWPRLTGNALFFIAIACMAEYSLRWLFSASRRSRQV